MNHQQILNKLQKIVPQIPTAERVLARKWVQRLKQQSYFPKEQRINNRYFEVLEV
jgi:hypothetical protein